MEKRAHADRCYELPADLREDMGLMIEVRTLRPIDLLFFHFFRVGWPNGAIQAKDKEQAVLMLYRIYNLHPVIYENLRPEKPPKPFVRGNGGGEEGEEGGEELVDEEGNPLDSPEGVTKKRRTRSQSGGEKKGKKGKVNGDVELEGQGEGTSRSSCRRFEVKSRLIVFVFARLVSTSRHKTVRQVRTTQPLKIKNPTKETSYSQAQTIQINQVPQEKRRSYSRDAQSRRHA